MFKIAFIGAGSFGFTRTVLKDVLSYPLLQGSEIVLMDIHAGRLEMAQQCCQRIIDAREYPAKLRTTMDRREALKDADGNAAQLFVNPWPCLDAETYVNIAKLDTEHDIYVLNADDLQRLLITSNPDAGPARAADLALDGKGDIYVAGSYEYLGLEGAALFKVAGAKGTKLKGDVYEPRHGDASSYEALAVRGSSVVATGSAWTKGVDGSRNALIVKFDRSLQMKARKEWGVGNKSEEWFYAAVIDGKGSVFVTGEQWLEDKYEKVVTMKLDAKLKKVVWSTTYMPASKYAMGLQIARDGAGNVYVGGVKNPDRPKQAVLTIKYSAAGARKWARAWTPGSGGSVDGEHGPAGLVLGSKDGVYVGGHGVSKAGVHQAVLLKYQR